ncbi:hypothetical protein LTR12_009552 [Friedmanniomyces endolithicus]|nr:hypothetical protein LTR74_008694 [Friedmanniomyces endolithicus]KAK1816049.1 hypothetical protein LTR12_009552 [Friedmanniomyces endolithicus]
MADKELTLSERTAHNAGRVIDYPRSPAMASISICVAAITRNLSKQQAGTEQTTDTRAYPEIPPPCSHPCPHQDDVPLHYGSTTTECTLPSYHTDDVVATLPPPPLAPPAMNRHKSVSRSMLSKVRQGFNTRSKPSLSIRPIESDTSLLRRLSGRRKQSSENEQRARSFEVSRDSVVSMAEEDPELLFADACGQRSCTDSTVSTSELVAEVPPTPGRVSQMLGYSTISSTETPRTRTADHQPSPGLTPVPTNDRSSFYRTPTIQHVVVPCVELTVSTDLSTVDAGAEQEIWVAIDANVRGNVHPAPAFDRHPSLAASVTPDLAVYDDVSADGALVGAITSLRLCYKPVSGSSVIEVVGQKAVKDVCIGQSCTLFVRAHLPKVQTSIHALESKQSSLLAELESIVGTLETEVLHVEARYRCSLFPYSNVVTVRYAVKIRRPKTESRWSIVGTYSDMTTSEQMYTKLAIYLADSYPPDRALKYIDRYLAKEAEQDPVRQIRQKVAGEIAIQHSVSPDSGDTWFSNRKPTVVVTDNDIAFTMESPNYAEGYAIAPYTPSADFEPLGKSDGKLASTAPGIKSRSTSLYAIRPYEPPPVAALSPSKSTMSIAVPCKTTATDATDEARRLWRHICHSSLSAEELLEMAPQRLEHLEAGDETLRELRRRALANKRSVGAETLKGWKWDCGQVVRLGEAPWL